MSLVPIYSNIELIAGSEVPFLCEVYCMRFKRKIADW